MSRIHATATLATAVAAAALIAPAAVPPAAADVAVREYAETSLVVVGHDGARYAVYLAGFRADEVGNQPSTAVVQIRRCPGAASTCTTVLDARIAIPASAFTVGADLSTARLTTSFRGVPINVTWTATADKPVVPGLQAWATPTVRVGPQRSARATFGFLGMRCPNAFAVISHETTVSANDLHAPTTGEIPAALRGTPAPRCPAA